MTDLFTERDKKKAKAFVKGANTGIAQILGFPVDMVNMAPLLLNLLPGKQGMQPFSGKPVGGSQTFKDLMAAGNVGTYKGIESIPKDEYGAGIAGMLSAEALTSLIPISQLVKGLPKGSKTVLPQQTATGVDLSRRDLLKKAGAAAVATAVSPSIIKELGDVLPSGATTKAVKAGAKSGIALATSLAKRLSDLGAKKDQVFNQRSNRMSNAIETTEALSDYLTRTNKINDEMNAVTVQLNDTVEKLVKGKGYEDFMKMPENEFLELARLTNKVVHNFRNKAGEIVGSLDPLREPKVQEALDKAITDRGLRPQMAEEFAEEVLGALRLSDDKRGGLPPMDLSGLDLPKMLPSSGQATKSIFAPEAKKGRQLLIVSCSNNKCPDVGNMKALDRYTGQLFTKMKAEGIPPNVDIAILSAKHGLIRSDTEIEKYDQLMTPEIRDKFINDPEQMNKIRDTMAGDYDKVFVTGGKNYRDVIDAAASGLNYEVIKKKAPGLTQQAVTDKLKEAKGIKVDRSNPTEPAFHYSTYTDKQIKNFSIEKVEEAYSDADTNYSSILGLHVGTPEAAAQRSRSNLKAGYFTKDSDKVSYAKPTDQFTLNYDFKDEDMIPMGSYYALDIDTSKPFKNPNSKTGLWTERELDNYIIEEIDRNPTVSALYKQKSVETRGDKIFELNKKIGDAEKEAFEIFRKGLASKGFTNIPYINAVEDRGSISQIMLIDRPKGDKVIKSKITAEPMEKGGVAGLSDIARDMFKGPKGIGAYQPFMVG